MSQSDADYAAFTAWWQEYDQEYTSTSELAWDAWQAALRAAPPTTNTPVSETPPQPASEAVENALDAVQRAFGSDWTPEQGEAMDKLTDTVRAALLGKTTSAGQLGVRLDAQGQIACGQGIGTNAPAASPEEPHEAPTPLTDALVRVVLGVEYCNATEMKDNARRLERALAAAIERERLANMRADQAEEARDAARRP